MLAGLSCLCAKRLLLLRLQQLLLFFKHLQEFILFFDPYEVLPGLLKLAPSLSKLVPLLILLHSNRTS